VTSRIDFMIGGFSGVSVNNIKYAAIFIVLGLIVSLLLSYDMKVLSLGDKVASSLGLNVKLYRFIFIIVATLLAGSAVSLAGLLGFIGLIVPHSTRLIIGKANNLLIPACALLGASFTLICDLISRTAFAPYEIPVGIIMSFFGAPFFIYLLFSQKRGRLNDRA
ncbi:MAG: FecCD family ABC transporter permease, partial [Ruminiclostridium sp.]